MEHVKVMVVAKWNKMWQLFLSNVLHVFPDVQLYLQFLHAHFTINYLLTGSD
jgi:hypothetical protein